MYKCRESGLFVYETFDELLNAEIVSVSEYEGFYYIRLKPQEFYDNSMWKVDKKTKNVSLMYYTEYLLEINDKAKHIDPAMLRTLKRGA